LKIAKHFSLVGSSTRFALDGPSLGGEILRTRPDPPWGPHSVLNYGYRGSFPEVKRPGLGVDDPPKSNNVVQERVELYSDSPSGLSKAYSRVNLSFYHLLLNHTQSSRSPA
jgi:hypothetical protein